MKFSDKKRPNNAREHKINDEIRSKSVYLISNSGDKLGIKSIFDALNLAYENQMDLVQMATNDNIPVCKIMNYGKFCFEQKKKKKNSKKELRHNEKKTIQLNPAMADNDLKIKLSKTVEFLKVGYKVLILMKLKGRQVDYPEIALKMMNECIEFCNKISKVESAPKLEGKKGVLILAPLNVQTD